MKQFGLAYLDAMAANFALDPDESLGVLCVQGGAMPPTVSKIHQLIHGRDDRKAVVIVQGDLEWCREHTIESIPTDVQLFCASEDVLKELGVPIIDAGFEDEQIVLESMISGVKLRIVPHEETDGGFWSKPKDQVDQTLFDGDHLKSEIRSYCLAELYDYWAGKYVDAESWSRVWIAGSGVSLQYHIVTDPNDPADIDVLIGINVSDFIDVNPSYKGWTEEEIALQMNEEFNVELEPETADYNGFNVTFFVNPGSWDIRDIVPYAAYSLTDDDWTVPPTRVPDDWDPMRYFPEDVVDAAYGMLVEAHRIVDDYNWAKDRGDDAAREDAVARATEMFEGLYHGRQTAFRPGGEGYFDRNNFNWQFMKHEGALNPLHQIKNFGMNPVIPSIWIDDMSPSALYVTHEPNRT